MSIPSLSIDRYDRYTPEIRDKIVENLRARLPDTVYHVLTPARLRTLADTVSASAPVLSFYMELTPDRRIGGTWRT